MNNEKEKTDVFALAKKRRDSRRAQKQQLVTDTIKQCSYEGCSLTSDDVEIQSYYKKDYCPSHLVIARKERKQKKKPAFDLTKFFEKMDDLMTLKFDQFKKEFKPITPTKSDAGITEAVKEMRDLTAEMRRLFERSRTPSPEGILMHLWNEPDAHTLKGRLLSKFAGPTKREDTDKYLRQLLEDKILWINGHGWYIVNPNFPKERFVELTGMKLTDGEWKDFIREEIYIARKHINNLGIRDTIERELFFEWDIQRREEVENRWKIRTRGRGGNKPNPKFIKKITTELLDEMEYEDLDIDDIKKFDIKAEFCNTLNIFFYTFRKITT